MQGAVWRLFKTRLRSKRAVLGAVQGISLRRTYTCLSTLQKIHISAHPSSHGCCNIAPSVLSSTARSISSYSSFYAVIHGAEAAFLAVHSFTHFPWWGVVIATTTLLRSVLTLPLAVYQNKIIAKMELLLPTLKEYQEAVKHNVIVKCRRENLPVEEANRRLKKAVSQIVFTLPESQSHSHVHILIPSHKAKEVARDLYAQEGCSPYRVAILPWVQLPLWITLSFALRDMAGVFPADLPPSAAETKAGLSQEGCLWFPDLTLPDPYFVLPIILVATNLCNIELHAIRRQTPSRPRQILTNSLRLLSVGMLLVAIQMPAVMTLYWATSSSYGLVQNILFNFPHVRRGLKIPRTPSESQTPFRDLWAIVQQKSKAFIDLQRQSSRK